MKHISSLRPLASTFASSICLTGLIAFSAAAQEGDTVTLSTVVVSATKSPVSRDQLTQSVTVISGDELRAHGVARVSDALQLVPGVTVAQNGSFGSVSSLFLRGGESRYTKVLIDGVAVNQSGGFFDFSHLTTDNVERIEIVRGPSSVLYGADAVTGVIQVFTRQGRGPLALSTAARGGTYGTFDGEVGISGSSGGIGYTLDGGAHRTDGLLSFNNEYSNGTLSGSMSATPRPGTVARLTARYSSAEFHYPTDYTGAPVDSNSYRVQHRLTVGLDAGAQITSVVRAQLLAGTNELSDLTEDIAIPFGASSQVHSADMSRGHRRSVEGRLLFALPAATTINVGVEYVSEKETSTNTVGAVGSQTSPVSRFAAERSDRAVYAEVLGSLRNRLSYTVAARVDDNSDYASYSTCRLGTSIPVSTGTRLHASWSTAFSAPAFSQLRPTLYTVGSPDLTPEHSRSWEAGIGHTLASGFARISASYFNQRFRDLIQYVSGGPPSFLGSYANLTEAESNGYEGEIEITPPGIVSGSASLTRATPKVTRISSAYVGDLTVGQALIRRPTHSGTVSLSIAPKPASLSVTASYIGKRPDVDFAQFPSPTVTLPAYVRLDAGGAFELWRGSGNSSLAVTARAENALNRRYETVLRFPAPGRVILIGARFNGSL